MTFTFERLAGRRVSTGNYLFVSRAHFPNAFSTRKADRRAELEGKESQNKSVCRELARFRWWDISGGLEKRLTHPDVYRHAKNAAKRLRKVRRG